MKAEHILYKLSQQLISSLDLDVILPQAAQYLTDAVKQIEACQIYTFSVSDGALQFFAEAGSIDPSLISDRVHTFFSGKEIIQTLPPLAQYEVQLFRLERAGLSIGVVVYFGHGLDEIQPFLGDVTNLFASSVQNGISYGNLIRERMFYDQLTLETRELYQLTRSLSTAFESQVVIQQLLHSMADIFKTEVQALLLVEEEAGELFFNFLTHFDKTSFRVLQEKIVRTWTVLREQPVEIVSKRVIRPPDMNINTKGLNIREESQIGSWLSAPLVIDDRSIGLLFVASVGKNRFRDYHIEFLYIVAGMAAKVLENTRLNERMKRLAAIDGLTGVYNHRTFQEKLDEHFSLSRRYKTPLSLIMADIDHFKKFNDSFGHQTGDEVLKLVANTLRLTMREVDIICRYGGEEFVIILPQAKLNDAARAAERLRTEIENKPFNINNQRLHITVSLGISSYPDSQPNDREDLIAKADEMLYIAKKGGRNQVVIWPGNGDNGKN